MVPSPEEAEPALNDNIVAASLFSSVGSSFRPGCVEDAVSGKLPLIPSVVSAAWGV